MSKKQTTNTPTAHEMLRSIRDRIVRLEEEKKSIADDIKGIYAEGKSLGLDTKALRVVVKRAMEDRSAAAKRRETEEIADIYLANLGMLDGTPLGDSARDRLSPPELPAPQDGERDAADGADPAGEGAEPPAAPPPRGGFTEDEIAAARERGAEEATEGKRIIDNPFVAGDPRRAAWDEGHCQAKGSDGMEIPEAWRRAPKSKPAAADGEGAAQ